MKKIIYDCDNTMGIRHRDVDDALTILYLLGRKDVELLGITTTFGNDTLDAVFEATCNLVDKIHHKDIPVVKGGGPRNRKNRAAAFLASTAAENAGEITLIATGALTNLYGARLIDDTFWKNIRDVVVMGGVTEPLLIAGEKMDELNFSCDPEATYDVLRATPPKTVITGNLCLSAFFGETEFSRLKRRLQVPVFKLIYEGISPWRDFIYEVFKLRGFYNWDVVAGIYATQPELFENRAEWIESTPLELKKGFLKKGTPHQNAYALNIPRAIKNIDAFNDTVFEAWENVSLK